MADIKSKNLRPLLTFSAVIFFITIADAIMSYVTPVYIENVVDNSFLMGIILSCSSLFGIFFDIFLAEKLNGKSYKFIVFWTIVIATIFPTILGLLPPYIPILLAAMVIWSTYYELRDFSKYNFIRSFVKKNDHVLAWSIVDTFSATAYLIGPILAVYMLSTFVNFPFFHVLILIIPAYFIYFFYLRGLKEKALEIGDETKTKRSLKADIKIMKNLWSKVWPLVMFMASITLIDVCFWMIGVLLSEELRLSNPLGGSLLVVYGLPALINGIIASKVFRSDGKKRSSFMTGLIAACGMIAVGITHNIYIMLVFIFITAVFYGQTYILMQSVFEDYVSRLKGYGTDMVGISQIAINSAYFLGPIILGAIAEKLGNQMTFSVVGIFIIGVTLFVMTIIPRKVRMPNKLIDITLNS